MSDLHILAIDLAKRSFQVCGTDRGGAVLFNRTLSHPKLMHMLGLTNIECKVVDLINNTTSSCWRGSSLMWIPRARGGERSTLSATGISLSMVESSTAGRRWPRS